MNHIDWNEASELGLIERINKEVLHPLGLAMSRNPGTGHSTKLFIAEDGAWEYAPGVEGEVIPDNEVRRRLMEMVEHRKST